MYAMQYAEGNFVQNAARLYLQNNDNNLATQGALINAHVKAREQQAEAALRDKTPLITIGRATGHLSDKGYGYSPDLGTVMMFSWRIVSRACSCSEPSDLANPSPRSDPSLVGSVEPLWRWHVRRRPQMQGSA
jgi:hypothetical protein